MKVVFLESIEGTAIVGDVKEVKNGFARNYLLPNGLAAPAKEPYLTKAAAGAKREAKRQEALDQEATVVAEKLEGQKVSLTARVGDSGRLFGSVTSVHIAEEVAKLLGDDEFEHRKVLLPEAIKEIGVQPVRLRLTRNIEATIEVEVLAEGVDEDEIPIDAEDDAAEASLETEAIAEAEAGDEAEAASEEPVAELEEGPAAEAEEAAEESSEEGA
jgi:large subunit ribosomal protein L9